MKYTFKINFTSVFTFLKQSVANKKLKIIYISHICLVLYF